MFTNTQDAGKEIDARFYLRVKRQIQAWSLRWGKKELIRPEAQAERPWAGVAEWLRVAHSLLDEQAGELTRSADRASPVRAIK